MNHEHARQSDDFVGRNANKLELNEWLRCAIDQHEHALVRYAQQFVGDIERARDVVQDTFMKLCHYDRTHDRLVDTHLTKWLYKVCRNRAIDIARKEKRMKFAPSNQFDEQLDAATNSPEATVIQEERQEALVAQIAGLPDNQQEVLRLKFHGGLSYQEIAEVMGLTKTNVGFLLHAAISKLRQRVVTNE